MNMSLLDAAYADSRDSIQLEAAYKAFQDGTGKGGTGPSLQEKQNKATRDQIRWAQWLGEDLIREDLCNEDHISASQDQDAPGSPNPYDRHNASVSQTTKSAGTREGRYQPTCSTTFIDRLQTAKREKEELKIKSMDSSTAHQRAYIVIMDWEAFFKECGIKDDHAEQYAKLFDENRIQESHIPELNKELLKDLGISVIGDVISILKFSSTPAEPKVASSEVEPPVTQKEKFSCDSRSKVTVHRTGQLTLTTNLRCLGPEVKVQQEVNETVTVEMDKQALEQQSRIYGKSDKDNLTRYQRSINDAAFKLCCENTDLLKNKGKLLDLARKMVDSEGYNYAKKRSRSKTFGSEIDKHEGKNEKRQKLTEELRHKKISELCEDIETVNKLAIIQAKEAKSKGYHQSKSSSVKINKSDSEVKDKNQISLKSFFNKTSNNVDIQKAKASTCTITGGSCKVPEDASGSSRTTAHPAENASGSSRTTAHPAENASGSSRTTAHPAGPHSDTSSDTLNRFAASGTKGSSCEDSDIERSTQPDSFLG
ncbi:hypothetical protein OS493_007065 [Desmophyllum pertusum]|uniref:NAB co-repressor domain-containing protein n=1 Tax=Desmophyllum pertusum TaxID=174260 RepID=A0A9X0CYL1_9CNID|nr:hypothetical protein OS493_007065 [Desmophyllum pertusum]